MKSPLILMVVLIVVILSVGYALDKAVRIPSSGQISYPAGVWEYESTGFDFCASDVVPGGTTVIAGDRFSGAIWKSTQEGKSGTWVHMADLPGITEVWMVYYSPYWGYWFASGDYGGGEGGLYRSKDDGSSWTKVWSTSYGTFVHSSGICEDENGTLYIGAYNSNYLSNARIYKSVDGGANWTVLHGFGGGHVHCLRYNPATKKMWAFIGDPGYDGCGLYWSSSPFTTWTRTTFTEGHMEDVTSGYPMSFECYGTYLFFTIHWDNAKCVRADFQDPPISNPTAEVVWQGGYDRLNWIRPYKNWMLASGEASSGRMKIGGSDTAPFGSGTWKDVYTDGVSPGDGGCAAASHHWSLNGWFFVANTITGNGIRIRYK